MREFAREIEKKYTLRDMGYEEAFRTLTSRYSLTADSVSVDRFWRASGVDFVRLRENSREMTLKITDRGDITDRIEENVVVEDVEVAYNYLTLLHGLPCLTLTKEFAVFMREDRTVLCLYRVLEDPSQRVFFEAEADSIDKVNQAVLEAKLPLHQEKRSLFQVFMGLTLDERAGHVNRGCKKMEGPCSCGAWHSEADMKEWRP